MTRFELLGGLRVTQDGKSRDSLLSQRRRCAIAVYLAAERDVSREAVLRLFWPDHEAEKARHVLSQTLYQLRLTLGDDWLDTHGERLVLASGVSVDVHELEALAAADGGFRFEFENFGWGGDWYREHGEMMPEDGLQALRGASLHRLTELDLSQNEFGREGAAVLAEVPLLSKLTRLDLRFCALDAEAIRLLLACPGLRRRTLTFLPDRLLRQQEFWDLLYPLEVRPSCCLDLDYNLR